MLCFYTKKKKTQKNLNVHDEISIVNIIPFSKIRKKEKNNNKIRNSRKGSKRNL